MTRANLLAREAPNIAGYLEWRRELDLRDQHALTDWLFRAGAEYNDGSRWSDVLEAAGLSPSSDVAAYIWSLRDSRWAGLHTGIFPWLPSLDSDGQLDAFRLAAAFFAINELERYQRFHEDCAEETRLTRAGRCTLRAEDNMVSSELMADRVPLGTTHPDRVKDSFHSTKPSATRVSASGAGKRATLE
jgi:hypothetical protein